MLEEVEVLGGISFLKLQANKMLLQICQPLFRSVHAYSVRSYRSC